MGKEDNDRVGIALLCVEDENQARERLVDAVRRHYPGVTVFEAANGEEGLASFTRERPAIVLTDIRMPRRDGISMAARIRSVAPDTEIIALTAHADAEYLMAAMETGIGRYLLKPVLMERLFETLDGILGRIRDRRRVAAMHRELARRARELELANRELDSFAAAVAHDLRAPLASVTMLAELLLNRSAGESDRATLAALHGELVRLNRMVGKLLAFARQTADALQPQWTDLSRLASEIAGELSSREPERGVMFRIAPGLVAYGDPLLMRTVLENLFGNAWKYTRETPAPLIEFGVTRRRRLFFVRDNGQGFDQSVAGSLFEEFRRAAPGTADGHGIGLATVRRIIARHGGVLKAVGKPGGGAVFLFTLPAPDTIPPPPSASPENLRQNQSFTN